MDVRRLPYPRVCGFTLLELMITLAVAAILVTAVVPAFSQLLASTRITTSINELMTHIHLARSEAIKRGTQVGICPSENGTTCLGSVGWSRGWIVFIDENWDENRNPTERVLGLHGAMPPQITIHPGRRARIVYEADGTLAGVFNGTFELCDVNNAAEPKAIIISVIGRPRVSLTRSDGNPLRCS